MCFTELRNSMELAAGKLETSGADSGRWADQIAACCTGLRVLSGNAAEYDATVQCCSAFFAQFRDALQEFCGVDVPPGETPVDLRHARAREVDAAFAMLEPMILFVREKALRTGYSLLSREERALLAYFKKSGLWPGVDRHNILLDTYYGILPAAVVGDMMRELRKMSGGARRQV